MKPLLIIELPCQADNIDVLNDSDIKKAYDVLVVTCPRVGIKYKVINIK